MTNFERWQTYMAGIKSPQSFIDFGFYYLIGASLQRRVWCGPSHMPLFSNTFIGFVGEPGIGKGLVLNQVASFLKYHELEVPNKQANVKLNADDKTSIEIFKEATAMSDYQTATGTKSPAGLKDAPRLIPVAADATTYEALVVALARSTRHLNFRELDPITGQNVLKTCIHASICFCLPEAGSLFRRKTEDTVNFMLQTYDCGDYHYDAKTAGLKETIKNSCLNFLAGTTPNFMKKTFNADLLGEGFSSRCWFIFESQNRFETTRVPDLTPLQEQCKVELLAHIKKLTRLYGRIEFEDGAEEWLDNWWKTVHHGGGNGRANLSDKLKPYYSRKDIHVKKMAMIQILSEHAEDDGNLKPIAKITIHSLKRAIETLAAVERKMHLALMFNGRNPLGELSNKIEGFLTRKGAQTFNQIYGVFYEDGSKAECQEACNTLVDLNKIVFRQHNALWKYETIATEPSQTSPD